MCRRVGNTIISVAYRNLSSLFHEPHLTKVWGAGHLICQRLVLAACAQAQWRLLLRSYQSSHLSSAYKQKFAHYEDARDCIISSYLGSDQT